jgi:hypothetical protein
MIPTLLAHLLILGQFGMGPGPGTPHVAALNPTIVGAWPVNDGSGSTVADVSGNANNIAVAGTPLWQSNSGLPGTTIFWQALCTPGCHANNFAQASSATLTNFTGSSAFSVAAWIATTATTSQVFLSTLKTTGNFQGWELGSDVTGPLRLSFYLINSVGGNTYLLVNGSTTLSTGALFYVVSTYDGSGSASGVKLYVNGVAETMTTVHNTFSGSAANAVPVLMGTRTDSTSPMSGPIAFAEVYSSVLTSTQVAAYYAAGPGIH